MVPKNSRALNRPDTQGNPDAGLSDSNVLETFRVISQIAQINQ